MTTIKGDNNIAPSQTSLECCMCGDSGLISELFQCKTCQFRSQHRYCSNLYPKSDSYKICNWCLSQKDDTKEKSQNSSNSSASHKNIGDEEGKMKKSSSQQQLQVMKRSPIKKPRSSPERSPPLTATVARRKRIITRGRLEEKMMIRRAKSEEISNTANGLITRHVFRNKVRRYKLLDEVSS
ncbi:hypothetical protein SLEP1_g42095 [Rubroshorea leprosula]|uniref:PHD-type zinc finger plants domain-containing protein n=1 Tax=Rubroshorea leprosula TaxID=152421 RepID=A0AAV5L8P3_9ROSI|nr:hypothetical protein SLEP1_g42095 [Rubroshorea leprosula]